MTKLLSIMTAVTLAAGSALGAISYTIMSSVYSENFDSLPYTGTSAPWTDNTTLPGWYLVIQNGNVPGTIGVNNGSSTTGSFYSYGPTNEPERALGGLGSGGTYFGNPASNALAGYWGVRITNNTGYTITDFTVGYDVEQWRDQNTSVQPLVSEWAINPTDWLSGSWNAGTSTNSPQNNNAGILDGNAAANRVTGVNFSASSLSWANGQTLWIRFREWNDTGNDHGIAIDNFTFRAVPEPATIGLLAGFGGLLLLRRRFQR